MRCKNNTIMLMLIILLTTCTAAFSEIVRTVPSVDYPTIWDAASVSDEGDVVLLVGDLYTGPGNVDINPSRRIIFRSKNPSGYCVIDCNGTPNDPHRAFILDNGGTLEGITIINGYADEGGAVECERDVQIVDCVLENNHAERGGALYHRNGSLGVINSTITGNTAEYNGGGISCDYDSKLTIKGCDITGNSAEDSGGGIYLWNAMCTISDSNISDNNSLRGGGIHFHDSDVSIFRSSLIGNSAQGDKRSSGGAIYCQKRSSCKLFVSESEVCDNHAIGNSSVGGGIYSSSVPVTITNCKIGNNSANTGSGIYCHYSHSLTVANSLINGNCSTLGLYGGGGLYCENSATTLKECTIVGNKYFGIYSRGKLFVNNCIFRDNGNGEFDFRDIDADNAYVTYTNTHRDYFSGEGNQHKTDPCFIDPGYWDVNNAWVDGDYHLKPGSPCVDAGKIGPMYSKYDLDGNPRVCGQSVDMGCYELQNQVPTADAGPDQNNVWAHYDGLADVIMDGSGSTDPDSDPLSYCWSWVIDGNAFEANGVSPTIQLPAGETVVELVVNDGTHDSEPDRVAINAGEAWQCWARFSVQPRSRKHEWKSVSVFIVMPSGIEMSDINTGKNMILYPAGIEAMRQSFHECRGWVFGIAHFRIDSVPDYDVQGSAGLLTVEGQLNSGRYFFGSNHVWRGPR